MKLKTNTPKKFFFEKRTVKSHPLVSIIVPTYNNEKLIENCVMSIFNQSFSDFELIIVDDCSEDDTLKILEEIKDSRLRFFKTSGNSGSALARNIGIESSMGEYIFFIDGDCLASKNWVKEGLNIFKKNRCLGVEGKTYYVSKNYKPTASDDVVSNIEGGQYMAGNIAYSRKALMQAGLFKKSLIRMQDRDLGFRVLKFGDIVFSKKMVVNHQKFKLKFKKKINAFVGSSKTRVYLFKKYGDRAQIYFRIYKPLNFFVFLFPPAVLGILFIHRYKTIEDFKTILYIYPAIFYERISLWATAIKKRVFLI